jgi:hypothetical protein
VGYARERNETDETNLAFDAIGTKPVLVSLWPYQEWQRGVVGMRSVWLPMNPLLQNTLILIAASIVSSLLCLQIYG